MRPRGQKAAEALADDGRTVGFVLGSEERCAASAGRVMDGMLRGMRSPRPGRPERMQEALREALGRSRNATFGPSRMKGVPDSAVGRRLRKRAGEPKSIGRPAFAGRGGRAVDVKWPRQCCHLVVRVCSR